MSTEGVGVVLFVGGDLVVFQKQTALIVRDFPLDVKAFISFFRSLIHCIKLQSHPFSGTIGFYFSKRNRITFQPNPLFSLRGHLNVL